MEFSKFDVFLGDKLYIGRVTHRLTQDDMAKLISAKLKNNGRKKEAYRKTCATFTYFKKLYLCFSCRWCSMSARRGNPHGIYKLRNAKRGRSSARNGGTDTSRGNTHRTRCF